MSTENLAGPQTAARSQATSSRVFAHSRWDCLLVMQAIVQLTLLVYGTLTVGRVDWSVSLLLAIVSAYLLCANYFTIGHNFVHNPFFRSRRLNQAFSVLNSMLIGAPTVLHRIYHFNHHQFNNAPGDPEKGTVGDIGSTYKHSHHAGREEPLLRYAVLSYFRNDIPFLVRTAIKKRREGQLIADVFGLALMLGMFLYWNPLGFLVFYLPVWLLGSIGSQAQNYLEHHGGEPGDRLRNAVSCYSRLYNVIWFNNGFHQEHHLRPQVHWTRVAEVTPLLPSQDERCTVQGAHWFNVGGCHARSTK